MIFLNFTETGIYRKLSRRYLSRRCFPCHKSRRIRDKLLLRFRSRSRRSCPSPTSSPTPAADSEGASATSLWSLTVQRNVYLSVRRMHFLAFLERIHTWIDGQTVIQTFVMFSMDIFRSYPMGLGFWANHTLSCGFCFQIQSESLLLRLRFRSVLSSTS